MSSSYTGNAATAALTLELMTGADRKTAQQMRDICERLLDNDAKFLGRSLLTTALHLRHITAAGVTITDTLNTLATVQRGQDTPLLAIKADGAFIVSDWARIRASGALDSIVEAVLDAATDGTRIVALGTDTGVSTVDYSDDDGATWTAGATLGATDFERIYWNEAKSKFVVLGMTGDTLASADAAAAWGLSGDSGTGGGGLAVLASGNMIAPRTYIGTTLAFNVSTDSGDNWSNTGGTIPNGTDVADIGYLAGNNGADVYHVARRVGGGSLQISASADGVTWSVLASLAPPIGATFNTRPSLRMCPNTGLLVATCTTGGGQTALYGSEDLGVTWAGPVCLFPVLRTTGVTIAAHIVDAIGVAGGKLLATYGAEIFASDGIGY